MTCPGHREAGVWGEDQAGKPWRREQTGTGKQPGTADELYGHDAGVCHAAVLGMDGRAQLVAEGDQRTIAAAQVSAVTCGKPTSCWISSTATERGDLRAACIAGWHPTLPM
jgi:hypothetical protein